MQWAAVVLIVIDAIVIAVGFVTGTAVVPGWATVVLVLASMALMVLLLMRSGESIRIDGMPTFFKLLRETLPTWAVALTFVAFYGGWLIAVIGMLSRSTARNEVADQRLWTAFALAFAGAVLGFAGIARRRLEETR